MDFLTGDFTKCWSTWGYENIMPAYDKFYYIIDGECVIIINNNKYIARRGQLFLLPYNSVQTYYHFSDNLVTKYWLHCTISCKNKDLLELVALPHYIEVEDPEFVTSLFEKILESTKHVDIPSKLLQKSYMLQLLAYYINGCKSLSDIRHPEFKDPRLNKLAKYIEANLHKHLTIEELSSIVNLHPNYFIRFFKNIFGYPPIEYINKLRIDKAKVQLQTDDTPIQNIALNLGFGTPYYFSKLFKKKTGFTPSEYRLIASAKPDRGEDETDQQLAYETVYYK